MKAFTLAFLIPLTLLLCGAPALAAKLEPDSVTLDDFANSHYFTITNEGEAVQTYSLSWKTPPTGEMVRFAPRRVTLEAGQSLIVNLLYRKPANLPDGEYASELLITPEENPERFEKTSAGFKRNDPTAQLDAATLLSVLVKAGAEPAQPPAP